MTQHDPTPEIAQPGQDWTQHANQWGQRARSFGDRARNWGENIRDRERQQRAQRPPRPFWQRLLLALLNIPLALAGFILTTAAALIMTASAIILLPIIAWLAMIAIAAAIARGRGWPTQIGALAGLLLGPIGVLLITRLPGPR